ncbi:C40 family peptidase [Brevibacillus dissolubilis]|uniref:C40 family peptidase n=1 Tax=Brevibacillus dissolubilis TaxID=1844116 RepID=UPI00159BE0B0|nr:C40 family peptidase [Brevibacillus dissolubilis]
MTTALAFAALLFPGQAFASTYVVAPGDTLYKIAKIHNVSVQVIVQQNQLENETIQVGQTLQIGGTAAATPTAPAGSSVQTSSPAAPASNQAKTATVTYGQHVLVPSQQVTAKSSGPIQLVPAPAHVSAASKNKTTGSTAASAPAKQSSSASQTSSGSSSSSTDAASSSVGTGTSNGSAPSAPATPVVTPSTVIEAGKQARVSANVLNARQSPSVSAPIVGKLSAGMLVKVLEGGSEWTKISYNSGEAYVATMYLDSVVSLPTDGYTGADGNTELLEKLNELTKPLLGIPYIYGGTTTAGFDCSGFTSYVFLQLGVTLPRTSDEQFRVGQEIPMEELVPGDLLFYDALNKGKVSHVAIYMGDGIMIHANGTEVRYEKVVNMHKLYPFYGAKRLIPSN